MSTLQVRDVPDETLDVLRRRADAAHLSLSEYLRGELARMASQPTLEEMGARIRGRRLDERSIGAADILRRERDMRS